MTEFRAAHASAALPRLAAAVLEGDEVGSRAGRVFEILHPHIVLTQPWRREIVVPGRRAALPAQIAETMWVLAGRDDVEWLERYLPRAPEFSDDGKVWRGAYGKRLRAWNGSFDQLAFVVDLLKKEPLTRRAVMSIYNPVNDSMDGKDIPCNDFIQFQSRLGYLHMHVFIRSNDLMWGWSGINAFEWSALQEVVAGLLGIQQGELHFSISNLHLYERHWSRARRLAYEVHPMDFSQPSPRFRAPETFDDFEDLLSQWFHAEAEIRAGDYRHVESFPEPMLRSWLRVIAWWWSKDPLWLKPLEGSALHTAAQYTPGQDPVVQAPAVERFAYSMSETDRQAARAELTDPFIDFVVNLHAEKDAVYGDSWRRRGEAGILGNVARKIDRLGVSGGGDTAADTVIDLLVYLVKYSLWLKDRSFTDAKLVEERLRQLHAQPTARAELPRQLEWLKVAFDEIEGMEPAFVSPRASRVEDMIPVAEAVARTLWADEQWKAGNATRRWNPEQDACGCNGTPHQAPGGCPDA